MIPLDEDAFLPTDTDRIKAQIKELKVRLAVATEKRRKLRRQLIEEDISYVVVSKITEGIKDPTRAQAQELEGLQKEIFEQLLTTAETCCVQEILSYHRLGGRTVFNYNKHHFGVRLETFYGKAYKEPYYIFFLKTKPKKVDKHTFPKFIPVVKLAEQLLPNNTQTFFRIVHDNIQAFVTRRELMNDIENLSKTYPITVRFKNGSRTVIHIDVKYSEMYSIRIEMTFGNRTSSYPTKIVIKDLGKMAVSEDHAELENDLLNENIVDVLKGLVTRGVTEEPIEAEMVESTSVNEAEAENERQVSVQSGDNGIEVEKDDGLEVEKENGLEVEKDDGLVEKDDRSEVEKEDEAQTGNNNNNNDDDGMRMDID